MGWIIFWAIVALYWVVGIKRMSVYFHRVRISHSKEWKYDTEDETNKAAAWGALGLASVWPYYESGRWLRDHIIHTMTAEQRRQKEYEAAEKIVAEYKKRQELEEREAFDREFRGKA